MDKTLFLKCKNYAKVNGSKVCVKDLAEVYCADTSIANRVKVLHITHLQKEGSRSVLSVFFIMEQIQKQLSDVTIQSIGENDVIVEWEKKQMFGGIKIFLVSLIAFFGTAFTIMAFHNDIDIRSVFAQVYDITLGYEPEGIGVLEISYCIGLFLGIAIFFNHMGKKMFTSDPTPITVAMYNYEKDVNATIVEDAERRGKEKSE